MLWARQCAWHQFHGEEGDAAFRQGERQHRGGGRFTEADDGPDWPAQEHEVGSAGLGSRPGYGLEDYFGGAEHLFAVGCGRTPCRHIRNRKAGCAGGFHQEFDAGLIQDGEGAGDHRHAAFVRRCFSRRQFRLIMPARMSLPKGTGPGGRPTAVLRCGRRRPARRRRSPERPTRECSCARYWRRRACGSCPSAALAGLVRPYDFAETLDGVLALESHRR